MTGLSLARTVVAVAFGALLILIGTRVVFCALQANAATPMVGFVTAATDPFIAPFESVLGLRHVSPGGTHAEFDVAALVALAGYSLLMALIFAILAIPGRRRRVVS